MKAPARTHGYITSKITELPALVWQYRFNESKIRRLYHRAANQPVYNSSTQNAITRREHDRTMAEQSLIAFGGETGATLAGLLTHERRTLIRLAEAAELMGAQRPELKASLANVRKEIKNLLAEASR